MTHGNIYELRHIENVGEESEEERQGELKFTLHVTPFTTYEEKRKLLAETSLPNVDGFYIYVIGWTIKTKEEVDIV